MGKSRYFGTVTSKGVDINSIEFSGKTNPEHVKLSKKFSPPQEFEVCYHCGYQISDVILTLSIFTLYILHLNVLLLLL